MTIKRFAEGTEVSVDRTMSELSTLLCRYGAGQIQIGRDFKASRAMITFAIAGRQVRLDITADRSRLPDPEARGQDLKKKYPPGWFGKVPWSIERRREWVNIQVQQAERECWRRLLLVVKAKLELVAAGGGTFEAEFLANILLADGSTVHEQIAARIGEQYASGNMVPLLPGRTT